MTDDAQARWFSTLVATALREGIEHVVLSPGSRSTPLVLHFLSAEKSGQAQLHPIIDERAAGFFALGLARVLAGDSRRAKVALVCTSGTAAAHYLPAVMEARAAGVPLLVLTADRPAELIGSGANQCADQLELFGKHVVSFCHLGDPKPGARALRGLERHVTESLARAAGLQSPLGPVHLNVPAEKPLEAVSPLPAMGESKVAFPAMRTCENTIDALAKRLSESARPVIVAGPAPLQNRECATLVSAIAEALSAPVLADLTSQLLGAPFVPAHDADFVLQVGRPPIDSSWEKWALGRPRVVLAETHWPDPTLDAEQLVFGPLSDALVTLKNALDALVVRAGDRSHRLNESEHAAQKVLGEAHASSEPLLSNDFSHALIANAVTSALPSSMLLFAGNSLAVRHLDLYGKRRGHPVLHQRGVSGIDGLVAGAAGAASTSGGVLLVLGDVSLRHDISSLSLHDDKARPLVVVVVNDAGGRVFERLPVMQHLEADDFERLFATKNDTSFERAALAFGAHYDAPHTTAQLKIAIEQALERGGTNLIEVRVAPSSARVLHARLNHHIESRQ